jgi:hypothetical protein
MDSGGEKWGMEKKKKRGAKTPSWQFRSAPGGLVAKRGNKKKRKNSK